VFEKDCLIPLGTCLAPRGQGKRGARCFDFRAAIKRLDSGGEVRLVAVPPDSGFRSKPRPPRDSTLGAGDGKTVKGEAVAASLG
jgi:hypothetical protein